MTRLTIIHLTMSCITYKVKRKELMISNFFGKTVVYIEPSGGIINEEDTFTFIALEDKWLTLRLFFKSLIFYLFLLRKGQQLITYYTGYF